MTMKWKGTIEFAQCSEMMASLLALFHLETKIVGTPHGGLNQEKSQKWCIGLGPIYRISSKSGSCYYLVAATLGD